MIWTADAFALFEKFEARLKEYNGQLVRAAVELAKEWRLDKVLRRLEAMLLVGGILIILGLSLASTNYLIDTGIPSKLFGWIHERVSDPLTFGPGGTGTFVSRSQTL